MSHFLHLVKAKLHHARITDGNLTYQGSLTVDEDLLDAVGMMPFEKVLCSNMAAGQRFETYVIPGKRGAGDVILNGPTAYLGKTGDILVVMAFALVDQESARGWQPKVAILDDKNQIIDHSKV